MKKLIIATVAAIMALPALAISPSTTTTTVIPEDTKVESTTTTTTILTPQQMEMEQAPLEDAGISDKQHMEDSTIDADEEEGRDEFFPKKGLNFDDEAEDSY